MRHKFLILLMIFLTGCLGSGSAEDDKFLSDTVTASPSPSVFGALGNSALLFTPLSYDFGSVSVGSTVTKIINIKNGSTYDLFLTQLGGGNTNFTVLSNDCPNWLKSQASCSATIRFNPVLSGQFSMGLVVNYSQSESGTSYVSVNSVSGRGVSPLTFAGITSITNVTTKSMRLNWTANSDATVFQGRAAAFFDSVTAQGLTAVRQQVFSQRDGTPLYEIWKVQP